MSNGIYTFLNTEISCIPKAIGSLAGKYYSNVHCNGATWLLVLWTVLHLIFDIYLNALLRKLKFKPYIRTRIKDSAWYLAFYSTASLYCWTTLRRDEIELFNFKKMHVPSETNISNQIIGYTLICTFYLHSSFWEGLRNGSLLKFVKYLCLAGLCISSYILKVVEIVYTLTAIMGISETISQMTRILYSLGNKENRYLNFFILGLFFAAFGVFTILHMLVIPLTFVVPLGIKILSDYPNTFLIFLYFCLLGWLATELYQSVLFNLFDHWLYHKKQIYNTCPNNLMECSLFMPRDDESYHLQKLRNEAKERQEEMIAKRKPKNRSMLFQTLKCMVAIKRKLYEKRMNDSSDSDSEKSDESILNEDVTENNENNVESIPSDSNAFENLKENKLSRDTQLEEKEENKTDISSAEPTGVFSEKHDLTDYLDGNNKISVFEDPEKTIDVNKETIDMNFDKTQATSMSGDYIVEKKLDDQIESQNVINQV